MKISEKNFKNVVEDLGGCNLKGQKSHTKIFIIEINVFILRGDTHCGLKELQYQTLSQKIHYD